MMTNTNGNQVTGRNHNRYPRLSFIIIINVERYLTHAKEPNRSNYTHNAHIKYTIQ